MYQVEKCLAHQLNACTNLRYFTLNCEMPDRNSSPAVLAGNLSIGRFAQAHGHYKVSSAAICKQSDGETRLGQVNQVRSPGGESLQNDS